MKRIKLSRLSESQLRRLLNRAEVRFGYDGPTFPDGRKKITFDIYWWLYDTDPNSTEWNRGNKKGNRFGAISKLGPSEAKQIVEKINNYRWEKISDPRFAEVVVDRFSEDGKKFYFRRKGFQWDSQKVVPASPNWIDSVPKTMNQWRPMTLSKRKVRFGDWRDEERKKYYGEIEKSLTDYYDDIQWYMNGNGFSGLKANVQRLQKYNPKMAKACEKLMKDFDERRKKLLTIIKPYIDEVKKRIRERG